MALIYAEHLASSGHQVIIKANVVDTVFNVPSAVELKTPKYRSKLGTILSALCEKQNADCIIASIIPMACFLYVRNRKKVTYFAQDYDESYYKNVVQKYLIRFLYYCGLTLFKIPTIAVSEQLADTLRKRFRARVSVVLNGVNSDIFYPDPSMDLILDKNGRKVILILSRSDRRKGFDIAEKVIKELLLSCNIPLEIWTVGEKATGKFNGVIHRNFGYVSESELRRIMSSADVFLYPSRHEGYGLMVVEAFACQCPVVTTSAVAFAKHEHNAMVSSVGDVKSMRDNILLIFKDQKLRQKLVKAGYSFAVRNSQKIATARFEKILAKLKPCS